MKTKEELEQIKEEVKNLSQKLAQLTEDELKLVSGGDNRGLSNFEIQETTQQIDDNAITTPTGYWQGGAMANQH